MITLRYDYDIDQTKELQMYVHVHKLSILPILPHISWFRESIHRNGHNRSGIERTLLKHIGVKNAIYEGYKEQASSSNVQMANNLSNQIHAGLRNKLKLLNVIQSKIHNASGKWQSFYI